MPPSSATPLAIQQRESEVKFQRELAKIFGVSKIQIQNTLKRKADVLAAYDDNLPNDWKSFKIFQFEEDIDSLTIDSPTFRYPYTYEVAFENATRIATNRMLRNKIS